MSGKTKKAIVAFQGERGAFSEAAIMRYWGNGVIFKETTVCERGKTVGGSRLSGLILEYWSINGSQIKKWRVNYLA